MATTQTPLIEKLQALMSAGLSEAEALRALTPIQSTQTLPVNTSTSVMNNTMSETDLSKVVAKLKGSFSKEEKVPVTIAVPYGKQTGGFVKVSINGQGIELPADGNSYKVPKSFAAAFKDRLRKLDEMDSAAGPVIVSDNTSDLAKKGGLVEGTTKIAERSFK